MVETGHFPKWPLMETRRPWTSSSPIASTVPAFPSARTTALPTSLASASSSAWRIVDARRFTVVAAASPFIATWPIFGREARKEPSKGGAFALADSTAPVPAFVIHHPPCQVAGLALYKRYSVVLFRPTGREQVMANPNEINPKPRSDDAEQSGPQRPGDKIYRLMRNASEAKEASGAGEAAKPGLKARPDDRKPEPTPPDESPLIPAAPDSVTPKKSLRRPLMFALLPLALIVGGYFYVTGGAVMSTDNAYVQADMVGFSTDVSGVVREGSV